MLDFHIETNDVMESDFQKEAITRYSGRTLDELNSVRVLLSKGILFSQKKGRARNFSPISYLLNGELVPASLRFVVVTNQASLGNKTWGRIDFLVNHRGYCLLDERRK